MAAEQEQVVPRPVALADLEDDLLDRHDVAAVAVEQHDRRRNPWAMKFSSSPASRSR